MRHQTIAPQGVASTAAFGNQLEDNKKIRIAELEVVIAKKKAKIQASQDELKRVELELAALK